MKPVANRLVFIFAALICAVSAAAQTLSVENTDPHYTEIGFFDIHLCNWPDRPPFYMALFSSTQYQNIVGVRVYLPDGKPLGELDMTRYRTVALPGKPEKHVFIAHLPLPDKATDGWFSATVNTRDGREISAKDYVVHTLLHIARETVPANEHEVPYPPHELTWTSVPGAIHYTVTLRDVWDDNREILASEVVPAPGIPVPPGLLRKGGRYDWVIHARDSNGGLLLGDFNHGSVSAPQIFSVAP